MVVANRERIDRALIVVRDGIRGRCEEVWLRHFGADWPAEVHARDRAGHGLPNVDDVQFLLKGIHNTWQEVWRHEVANSARNWVGELRDIRNNWAHGRSFTSDETYRMLDTSELLLGAFSASEHIALLQQMKADHRRQVVSEESRHEQRKAAAKATEGEPLRGLSPWREVITPHDDVASGRFEQAEFAADLHQVSVGAADDEYQDPVKFFRRTFLTSGLSDLLVRAARRLSGQGGDPVIDLQTNFGGGKTHSMIALYHLASGAPVADLGDVGQLLAKEKISLPGSIARAVVVGQMLSPSTPRVREKDVTTHTIWGELAYQLAGRDGYEIVRKDDESGTNPGNGLVKLFELAGPSVILIDEWVAYARQLPNRADEARMMGGDFDTQFTFAQALTESAAKVDDVVVLISIPASDIEVGGEKGREALSRLTNVVKRVSKNWAPATDDESFEIVRRRLFEPVSADNMRKRDAVIGAYMSYYREKSAEFPSEVVEADYKRRMELSYPVHPELFDRLYRDWSTLDRFQRTRGVLRLMAAVVSALWQKGDQNLTIMPGNFPLDDAQVSAELLRYLEEGWEPVVRTDVDGPNSLPLRIDADAKNLGRLSATRRVARAVFLASAPRERNNPGVESSRIVLGSAQPGESPGVFRDAISRLSNEATYVYVDGSRYWYSLQANINRLAAERANSNFNDDAADDEIRRRLQSDRRSGPFSAVHVFPAGPGDVADDDDGVHLVILPPTHPHVPNATESQALDLADRILGQRNAGPREYRNLLVFVAATEARLNEIRQAVRAFLAWRSVEHDKEQLQLGPNDVRLAETKVRDTDTVVDQRIYETFQSIIVPSQQPGVKDIAWDVTKTSGSGSLAERVARKLEGEEKLITKYSGTRVRMDLDRIPLWGDGRDISVATLWASYARYPYLPRLAGPSVLHDAVSSGAANTDWQRETFAVADAVEGGRWRGLRVAQHVPVQAGMLLVHPEAAAPQLDKGAEPISPTPPVPPVPPTKGQLTRFYASFTIDRVRGIRQLEGILSNIIDHLVAAPNGEVRLVLDVEASSSGYSDQTTRTVSENAAQLGATSAEFEADR